MKASFVKRLSAFLIDSFVLSIIFSIVTIGSVNSTISIDNEISDFQDRIESGVLSYEETIDEYYELFYRTQEIAFMDNIVSVVLYIGYFIVFGYLNRGQTIGKKIVKIVVVNEKGNIPDIWNMLFRSLFIYGILAMLYSVIFINIDDIKIFMYGYLAISYIEFFFIIISFFMMLYMKDGRGLHDVVARTKVIEEVR